MGQCAYGKKKFNKNWSSCSFVIFNAYKFNISISHSTCKYNNTIIITRLTSNTLSNRINKLFSSVYSESKIFNVSSIKWSHWLEINLKIWFNKRRSKFISSKVVGGLYNLEIVLLFLASSCSWKYERKFLSNF